ncbi:MAG: DivIVA domain-containing protein [Mycoplasmatales bacterium]|nr:DivIVA domain-containing protein [Mycoplasmatales bacterium]
MKKNNFKADMILNKKFSTEISGYNATEVDQFFDKVIEDYRIFEERIAILEDTINDNLQVLSERDEEINKLQLDLYNIKDQLSKTEKATNVELMKELKAIKEHINKK